MGSLVGPIFNHLAVEEMRSAWSMIGKAIIVGYHADRRSFPVQLG